MKSYLTVFLFVLSTAGFCQEIKTLKINAEGVDSIVFPINEKISRDELKGFIDSYFFGENERSEGFNISGFGSTNSSNQQNLDSDIEYSDSSRILASKEFREDGVWRRIESEPLGDFTYTFSIKFNNSECILLCETGSLYNGKEHLFAAGKEICSIKSVIGKKGNPKIIWVNVVSEIESKINKRAESFSKELDRFELETVHRINLEADKAAEEARLDSIKSLSDSLYRFSYGIIKEIHINEQESFLIIGHRKKYDKYNFTPYPVFEGNYWYSFKSATSRYTDRRAYLKYGVNDSLEYKRPNNLDLNSLLGKVVTLELMTDESNDFEEIIRVVSISDDVDDPFSHSSPIEPYIGQWSGIFSSEKYNGRWIAFVFQDGEVLGEQYSDKGRHEGSLTGKIINGELQLENSSVGAVLKGQLNGDNVIGRWNNERYNISGKFSGKRGPVDYHSLHPKNH